MFKFGTNSILKPAHGQVEREMILTFAMALMCATGLSPPTQRPEVYETRVWPPKGADPGAAWSDADSGPLGSWVEKRISGMFRAKLAEQVGHDSEIDGFGGIVDLAHHLQRQGGSSEKARSVMTSLFFDWPPAPTKPGVLYWFRELISSRYPGFAAKLTAAATYCFSHWLMGPLEIHDLDDSAALGDGKGQLLKVKRCRFLEEAQCASVCVNACMTPTQKFFTDDMGIPCTLAPNYEDLSCEFKFGLHPNLDNELHARAVACFTNCPANGIYRQDHLSSSSKAAEVPSSSSKDTAEPCPDLAVDFHNNLTADPR